MWVANIYACGYRGTLNSIDADGMVTVPTGPGWGVTCDWEFMRSHQIDQKTFN